MRYDYAGPVEWVIVVAWIVLIALFVVALIALARWLWRAGDRQGPGGGGGWSGPPRPDEPLEILRQRYARGEIDDEEYERRRRTLTGG